MQTEQPAQGAREQAGAIAETVKSTTKDVAGEAKQQAKSALSQMRDDAKTRADDEAGRVAQTLRQTSEQLHSVSANTDQGLVSTLAQEGARATERLAGRLDEGGVDAVLADVRSFARRNPGSFLVGAAFAGFVAGRIARNLSDGVGSLMGDDGSREFPANGDGAAESYGVAGSYGAAGGYGVAAPYASAESEISDVL
jgi:hypothetical protein